MSRAIDAGVKNLIKNGDHEKVFRTVAELISQRLPGKLLEIEFLDESFPLDQDTIFLQDDACIAIPKVRLLQAFLVARTMLARGLRDTGTDFTTATSRRLQPVSCSDGREALLSAAGVMLLMDPEHLTAANTRKRLLLLDDGPSVQSRLEAERYFVDSLLTSRLHRHTKSPTLWSHRQWLMERFLARGTALDVVRAVTAVVLVSAERHPRNYYAWGHARYLVDRTLRGPERGPERELERELELELEPRPEFRSKPESPETARIVEDVLGAVKKWAFSHHDDISGWAFLMFLLDRRPELAGPVVAETLGLAASLGWRNESVWYFLRTVVKKQQQQQQQQQKQQQANPAAELESSQEAGFRATRAALLSRIAVEDGEGEGEGGRRVLDRALQWLES